MAKICSKCKKEKEANKFNKYSRSKDGLSAWCKECHSSYEKVWRKKNPDKVRTKEQKYRQKHPEKRKEESKKYRQKYKEEIRQRGKIRLKKSVNKLSNRIRVRIYESLKMSKNNYSWEKILGFTKKDLLNYFEKKYGISVLDKDIHIDHIIPISLYNFSSYNDEEFKKCWNMRNLRPISSNENQRKSNKIDIKLIEEFKIKDLLPEKIKI